MHIDYVDYDIYRYSITEQKGQYEITKYFSRSITSLLKKEPKNYLARIEYRINGFFHRENMPAILDFNEKGKIICEEWRLNGELHRDGDLPAYIEYSENGKYILKYIFYKNGIITRDKYPAKVVYSFNGNLKEKIYMTNGEFNREDGPAENYYYLDGTPIQQSYYVNGILYREDGPAEIGFYENGKVNFEQYAINGELDRKGDEPASICYYKSGKKAAESYYKNGVLNRIGAPAVIKYFEEGNIKSLEYIVDGIRYREDNKAIKINYYINNNINSEYFINNCDKNGRIAKIERYNNGSKKTVEYKFKEELHRLDGPALIKYNLQENVTAEYYFINGKQYDELSYYVKVNSADGLEKIRNNI